MKLMAQLMAIGLAAALALSSTMACAMGGGGGGGGGMAPGTIAGPPADPANCGGLVCFLKTPAARHTVGPRSRRAQAHRRAR
jgi:hypothetical protein